MKSGKLAALIRAIKNFRDDKTNPASTGLQLGVGNLLTFGLKPLAEVERALLVVEVLHLPHPKLLGLLGGREHFLHPNKHMC